MRNLTDEQQTIAFKFADIALPDYATDCEPWEFDNGVWTRLFTVKEWQVGAVLIAVSGEQTDTGEVASWLYVGGEEQFDGSYRHALVAALAEASTLLDEIA